MMINLLGTLMVVLWAMAPVAGDVPLVIRQRVDLIELNHFVDEDGREVFRQVIFYDWCELDHRYHVRAWRLIKKPAQLPRRSWDPPMVQCTWGDEGLTKQVWAPRMRETWTQRDPERVNRTFLPEDQRVPLWPAHVTRRRTSSEAQSVTR